jgi:uncharacterized protein (TIGR02117 family)
MKILKTTFKWMLRVLSIPLIYTAISLILSYIPVGSNDPAPQKTESVFLHSNGTHTDLILAKNQVDKRILNDLQQSSSDLFFAFGWGDEDFYINTPTWAELKFSTAMKALFWPSETLMHVVRYDQQLSDWKKVKVSPEQLAVLNEELLKGFAKAENYTKTHLPGHSYFGHDEFYRGEGSYSCLNTCNSWLNSALKEADIKTALWTPFDFGIMHWHE